jgi:hypothetical protein
MIKATWVIFSVAALHEMAIIAIYWFLEFDPARTQLDYFVLMTHGGVAILVLIDGLVVSRIPVRLKHFGVAFLMAVIYLAWCLKKDTQV